jgi:DNA polymerase III sliding clamp (beta) subunit (PCNA family)
MLSILEDKNTFGIVKVTVYSDTFTEMAQLYKDVSSWHYNVNISKRALRFVTDQWIGFYTYTTRK